jgi:nicotinamidase/pyrazinamidase
VWSRQIKTKKLRGEKIMPETHFEKKDGLLIVDVQKDFCLGGALAVEDGDSIVPVLNEWLASAVDLNIPVYISRDWHPLHHMSFSEEGGRWPTHCVQDSEGAQFHPGLNFPENAIKITKGVRFDQDQYSVFDQTGFIAQLRHDGVKRLYVGGLALDVCVLASAMDAIKEGIEVTLILDATRPVDPEAGKQAVESVKASGAVVI